MKKIMDSITLGVKTLNNTKNKYATIADTAQDKLDAIKVANTLVGDDDPTTRLQNRTLAANSHVQYIEFIKKELNNIQNYVETKATPDFNHGCIYFGNGTIYYSPELLTYSEKEIFEVILNHIIHYTGCFYIISSAEVRLSYLLSAISVCYGESVNYKDGKMIYENNKDKFKHIIFDIAETYKAFIIRNRKMMKFIKQSPNKITANGELLIYRIVLGSKIKLENMLIDVDEKDIITNVSNCYSTTNIFELA